MTALHAGERWPWTERAISLSRIIGNSQVVKIPAGGGAQTTVGTGLSAPHGVAVDGAGDVFIADTGNQSRWWRFRPVAVPDHGGQRTESTRREWRWMERAMSSSRITDNNRVVEIPAGGALQTTVASRTESTPRRGGGWRGRCLHRG